MNTIGGPRQRTAADDQLLVWRVPSLLTRLLRINGSWDGSCGSGPPVPWYIRQTSEDLIQILGGRCNAKSLWSLTKVRLALVQRPAFNDKVLVQYLQKDRVVDGVEGRAEVKKDDSRHHKSLLSWRSRHARRWWRSQSSDTVDRPIGDQEEVALTRHDVWDGLLQLARQPLRETWG